MRTSTKIWLTTATLLIVLGSIIFVIAMSLNGWDFTKLNTSNYKTNTYDINQDFNNISFETEFVNIEFNLSNDGKCKVGCFEDENEKSSVSVENQTLTVKSAKNKKWYEYIGVNFSEPKITVYLPKNQYDLLSVKNNSGSIEIPKDLNFADIDINLTTGDVNLLSAVSEKIKIKTTTGNIVLKNAVADTLDLSVKTGDITAYNLECNGEIKADVTTGSVNLSDVNCNNFSSNGNTGDIMLNNVISKNQISIERTTGDIKFVKCDAETLFIKTSTGDVGGTLLSQKTFSAKSKVGDVKIPQTASGGKCEITTNTGDIDIDIY